MRTKVAKIPSGARDDTLAIDSVIESHIWRGGTSLGASLVPIEPKPTRGTQSLASVIEGACVIHGRRAPWTH